MSDQPPSTPRPKLTLVSDQGPLPPEHDPNFADTEPIQSSLFGSDERTRRDPLGAACTLVWLAHITLLEISEGAPASSEEWTATRHVVELAVCCLVLAQAQRVVESGVPYPRTGDSPLLDVLKRLTTLGSRGTQAQASERVGQLGRRLDLAVQCLFDWNAEGYANVSSADVFTLARELQFVYRDLRHLTG